MLRFFDSLIREGKSLKELVGCEESQAVCIEFRKLGHEAYSCDIQDCSGGHPEWHLQMDVFDAIENRAYINNSGFYEFDDSKEWDLGIFHPVCRYLANSGVKELVRDGVKINPERWEKLKEAMNFFNKLKNCGIPKIALENPIPHIYARVGLDEENNHTYFGSTPGILGYNQIVQPWMFGHKEMKATCLWLNGLPKLIPTDVVGPPPKDKKERKKWAKVHRMPPGPERAKLRSKTYSGIAKAMAEQWGGSELKGRICTFKQTDNKINVNTQYELTLSI
ncbi:MAG: cytosine methyltransferase [Bacteroidetes bacterium]|jgi:hypothetical protein|nr:cytosine methyltransferase [Bacteroidota bacterium]